MSEIPPLQQQNAGESPKANPINANFETLRLGNNSIAERIAELNTRLETPPEYNGTIETLNLFGIVDDITYDNNKLSADRLNENFEKFKIALLNTGGISGVSGNIELLQELASNVPNAPSDLIITGIIIIDEAYLAANPESPYELGDRIASLTWSDNSNNETDFEIYMPLIDIVNPSLTKLWFRPENGGYLVASPIQNAEFAEINLGQDFLYPLPENMVVPDPETPVEELLDVNLLLPDGGITRGQGVHFAIRAVNTIANSNYDFAMTFKDDSSYGLYRPYSVNVEFSDSDLVITFNNHAGQHITGYEVYISYAQSYLSGFEDYEMFPYKLAYTGVGDVDTEEIIIENFPVPSPVYDEITEAQLNKYLLVKVVAYNEIMRSEFTWDDREDVGYCELPEAQENTPLPSTAPSNFLINTNSSYRITSNIYYIPITWDYESSNELGFEVWIKRDYTFDEYGLNWHLYTVIPVGTENPSFEFNISGSGTSQHVAIRAYNQVSYSSYSNNIRFTGNGTAIVVMSPDGHSI